VQISPCTPSADGEWFADDTEADWVEAEAFSSVHDLVHHAILSQVGSCASLRQIYDTCERQGRIAYKRTSRTPGAGGSRVITANEHWKSQIRHALYTSPRFCRAQNLDDAWCVARGHHDKPATTTVRVNLSAASATPNCSRQDIVQSPKPAAAGRKRPHSSISGPACSPLSASSTRPRSVALSPATSSATSTSAAASASASPRGRPRARQSPAGRLASAAAALLPNARGRLFQSPGLDPEHPLTPEVGVDGVKPATAAVHNPSKTPPYLAGLTPRKRSKQAAQAINGEGGAGPGGEGHSFRDHSKNVRKQATTPPPPPVFENGPAPRDATRNRRKGKAERASDGMEAPSAGSRPSASSGRVGAAKTAAGKVRVNNSTKNCGQDKWGMEVEVGGPDARCAPTQASKTSKHATRRNHAAVNQPNATCGVKSEYAR